MQNQSRVYQIFYSKDIRKKKKVYSDGFLLCAARKTKLFNAEGQCLLVVNNKQQPQLEEEYTLNNTYVVVVDKEIPYQDYISGKIFLQQQVQVLPPVKKIAKKNQSLHKIELDVAKVFQNGLRIESFIYDRLRSHQVEGVRFMYECISGRKGKLIQGCILADFMGLGKTLQTLTLIRCAIIQKIANKIVVVCPLTLLKVWERQCVKWMGNKLSPLVTLGSSEEITKIVRMFTDYEYRLLIVSYQNFYKNSEALSKKCELLIFDEGHRLKNKKSKFFKKIQSFKCRKRILLTGTPLQNNLDQLYTCIAIVNPYFFQSETVFKNVFQKPILSGMAKNSTEEERALALSRTSELAGRIKQFSLRRKANVLEQYLPKKREYQIFLKLSPLQEVIYDRIKKKMKESDVLSFINVMRKLFVHPILFKNDRFENEQIKDCLEDCRDQKSSKIGFIMQIALQCRQDNEKLIIVSYFTETLDFVQQIIEKEGISVAKLDGRVDGQQRYRIVQSFFNKKDVLLLSGKAGGTGLTLTCACKMIMIEPDWNPSNDSQVMGRVWRQGQAKEVEIYRLIVGCSFQEKILQRQQLKQSLSEKLIDESKNNKSYDFFSLKQLFIQMAPKCITYTASTNKLAQCKERLNYLNWSDVVHVQVIQTHNDQNQKIVNEFEEADFEVVSEQSQKEDDEFNIDEAEDYTFKIDMQTKQQVKQTKQVQEVDEQTKSDIQPNHAQQMIKEQKQQTIQNIKQTIQQSDSKKKHIELKPQSVLNEQANEQIQIPLALRKLKKKLKPII